MHFQTGRCSVTIITTTTPVIAYECNCNKHQARNNEKKKHKKIVREENTYALPIFWFFFFHFFHLFHLFGAFQLFLCTLIQLAWFYLHELHWIGGGLRWCCPCDPGTLYVWCWIVRCLFDFAAVSSQHHR